MSFWHFWGKTRRGEKDGCDDYHLLCWHSLDVAAMGYLMVKRNCFGLADYFRQLGISDKEQAAQFFAWLLCWHDTGKFARSFQQLYLHPQLKVPESSGKNYEKISHSTLGYWLWHHYLSECEELLPSSSLSPRKLKRVIDMWMPITTGHHGRPPDRMDELDNFLPEDKAAARDFLLAIKALFPRVAQAMDIKDYWQKALVQAQNALTVFPPKAQTAPFTGINTLFPFIEHPTPLQQKVLDLDIRQPGPQLFILEDVTGAGKTEAALILAHRLMAAGKAQGLFFGLPTMATANAMYDRLVKTWLAFYSPQSRPSLVLAHSARTLMDRFNESLWSGDLVGSEEPDEQAFSQGCAAWFADSNKKALLAEIGVGTLDQAMMAVMPFKHNNLRLLGLSNKILLADEIHACDAYMSCILEGLIERQARGGNSVILLSATLSQQQRDKLVAAFARGTEGQQEAPFLEKDDYPWLTHVTKSDVHSHRVATRKDVERSVSVGWLHSEQECIARIESAVSQGKCIAWIRNSVDDAIKVYRQLLARSIVPSSSLSLFHSRFAFSDRQRIETETLARFGKESSSQRAGKVLICTQVLEQSVDCDLDEMISDLAPVDLLIQRAGRLQRHIRDINGQLKRDGKDERSPPELLILAPVWDDSPDEEWFGSAMRNSAYVYPDHGRIWLTQRVLREQGVIQMPHAARLLIESVYGEDVVMPEGFARSEQEQVG
ncbi:CRISPR-associated helicase Cas3', partial [Escherichia coli]|uniref:CRISPR-associated helicase Cas3' n=1 Tax=Escherichia coli TaxID=562 RepID=UPI003C71FFCA